MKSSAVTLTLATLFVVSANAAELTRRRTQTQHKSLDERYLGLSQNDRARHMEEGSMSMSDTASTAPEDTAEEDDGTSG